jgi:NDP-mannose synthase
MRAIILAGGKGSRLRPYTTVLPKPLMPVNGQPILEIILRQLRYYGFTHVTVALGHLAHLVQAVLGNGDAHDLTIDYSVEDVPLGTSGPLALIPNLSGTFLVMNGDVLTNINFLELVEFHKEQRSAVTIASHRRKVEIDYGVLRRNDYHLVGYDEKPRIHYEVSMGIYVFNSAVLRFIKPGEHMDIPDLIRMVVSDGEKVTCFPFDDIWFDLGRIDDFHMVDQQIDELKQRIPFFHPKPIQRCSPSPMP